MSSVGIIIQARMRSARLPGKVLKRLGSEFSVLDWVAQRCLKVKSCDKVIVATTDQSADDAIEEACKQKGYLFFRGDENNVLQRYVACASAFDIETVVRVSADSPFICPRMIEACLKLYQETGCDYVSISRQKVTFPLGLEVEVTSMSHLSTLNQTATHDYQREHVTPGLYQEPGQYKIKTLEATGVYHSPHLRFTIDTAEDFKLAQAVVRHFGDQNLFVETEKIISYLNTHPDITQLNHHILQKKPF